MSLLTCLAQLQPVINNLRLICKHVKTRDVLLGVKYLIKKHKVVATLISTHESASYAKSNCSLKVTGTLEMHFRITPPENAF